MYVEQDDIARIVASEELSLEDVKIIIRGVRYDRGQDERFDYADTLLSDAGIFLPRSTLFALVRAEISVEEAALDLERNKKFFSRLAVLLPSLVRFFSEEARHRNSWGIISTIDDCYHDFHVTIASRRKDRQLREAKEKLANASKLTNELVLALADAKRHFEIEFDQYRAAYYKSSEGPSRFVDDLVHELRICSGVLDITIATAEMRPRHLLVFGNDARTTVVESAHHMCSMWGGPKLVTTPGSDFAALCSFLFEAVSGRSDEGLAGAIIRYARSDARRRWDQEEEDGDEKDEDNFQDEKRTMMVSAQEIELCKSLLQDTTLSEMARVLLHTKIIDEQRKYQIAESSYGPRQVYISQMNPEQRDNMLIEAIGRLKPGEIDVLDKQIFGGKSLAALDIELGRVRRSKGWKIDV